MNDYKIKELFEDMEMELISSMKRNYERHLKEEKKTGFEYSQWQAEKIKELKRYQRENKDIIGGYTKGLSNEVSQHLQKELKQGSINAIKQYNKVMDKSLKPNKIMNHSFFRTNDKKVNALIKVVNNDLKTANTAVLRMANGQYRQVIHKSAFYVANGVFTEKQAARMATEKLTELEKTKLAIDEANKDFLSRGFNCIEYKDGRRVNIASYSEMAVRTASLRAQLMGEGDFRKSIGRVLVQSTSHGGACPICQKWENKIFIDDVYSGGTEKDGNYMLLSEAMKQGFLHPNCRHGLTTYYPEADIENYSDEEYEEDVNWINNRIDELSRDKLNYIDRNIKRFDRMAIGSLDPDNKSKYISKKKMLESNRNFIYNLFNRKNKNISISKNLSRVIDKRLSTELLENTNFYFNKYKDILPDEKIMWKIGNFQTINGKSALANENFQINKILSSNIDNFKNIVSFSQKTGFLVKTDHPVKQIVAHEIGHRVQIGLYRKISGNRNASRTEMDEWIKEIMSKFISDYEKKYNIKIAFIEKELSEYGAENYFEMFSEAFAEYTVSKKPRPFAREFGIMLEEMRKSIK